MKKSKLFKVESSNRDYYYKINNYLLKLSNKVRLAVTVVPYTKETNFGAIIKAGAYFEDKIGVPRGTAHFLEHLIVGNPNDLVKTKEEHDDFSLGTKYKSPFWYNGYTTNSIIELNANGNIAGTTRIIKFIMAMINYPQSRFSEFLEKERSIILNELKQRKKDENNGYLQFMRYFFTQTYPELGNDVLGTAESINSITLADIKKLYKEIYTKDSMVFYIQTNEFPSDKILRQIISKTDQIPDQKSRLEIKYQPFIEKFDYKVFKDEQRQNIFCSINFFYKVNKEKVLNYKNDRLYFILSNLLRKVLFDYIREESMLVYEIGEVVELSTLDDKTRGVYFLCRNENFVQTLNEVHKVLQTRIYEFLDSKKGEKWLNSLVSDYLFPRDSTISNEYASNDAYSYLFNQYLDFDYRKAKKTVAELSIKEIKDFTQAHLSKLPYIWIETENNVEEVEKEFKSSELYKYYSSKSS